MFWKYNILGILCILLIFIASATPGDQLPPSPFIDFDKIIHAIIYSVLQWSLLRGFLLQFNSQFLRKYSVLMAFIFSVFYGWVMEFMQGAVFRNRSYDPYDAGANIVGVIFATIIWLLFFYARMKRKFRENG